MKTNFEYKVDIILKEWDQCQAGIARFDTLLFNIRTWAITIFTAVVAGSISFKSPHLMLAILPSTIFLWLIDAFNKGFQRAFINRYQQIEEVCMRL